MRRAREAAAAENPHAHSEIAAVFLRVDVRGNFGSAEQRMQRAVNAAGFVDSFVIGRIGIVVASRGLLQRLLVGRVAVHFVGAHENKCGVAAMLARGFQQIHGAQRVHFKIQERDVRRFVMRRLRRAMDDQVEAIFAEQRHDPVAVSNIERQRSELSRSFLEPLEIP